MAQEEKAAESSLFCVGLIADIQYADADDSNKNQKRRMRRYRQALKLTERAVTFWNDEQNPRPLCIVSVGDLIDGKNAPKNMYNPNGLNQSVEAMKKVLTVFSKFKPPKHLSLKEAEPIEEQTDEAKSDNKEENNEMKAEMCSTEEWIPKYPYFHNLIGNHELYNFNRKQLLKYMYSPTMKPDTFYYSFSPFKGFVFIFLDSFKSMRLGYEYDKELYNKMSSRVNSIDGIGFDNDNEQINWLKQELIVYKNDIVILFVHVPLENPRDYIIPNDKLEDLIAGNKNIKMVFSGHVHDGIKTTEPDKNGVWYRTLNGVVEAKIDTDCFANLLFFKDKVELKGYGMIESDTYHFRK